MSRRVKRFNTPYHPRQNNDMLLWSFFIGGCLVAVAVMIAISVTAPPLQTAQPVNGTSNAPHYTQGNAIRTVAFGKFATLDTDKNHALAEIVEGSLPSGTTQVKVLSDENCAPDNQGISHCLNRLSYGSGEITVRHNHKMAEIPCLQPGEVLQVVVSNQ
jgi:hypothetical protein